MRFLIFFTIILLAMAIVHGYLGWRLVTPSPYSAKAKRRARLVLVGLTLLHPTLLVLRSRADPSSTSDAIAMVGFVVLGFTTFLFLLVLARDGLWVSVRLLNRLFPDSAMRHLHLDNPERRSLLLHSLNLGAVGVGAAGTAIGYWEARRLAQVVEVEVPIQGLPESLDGFSIAQISDIHIGPTIKGDYLRAVVDRVNELQADMVAVTGDLVDGSVAHLGADVAPLGDLRARHGAYFVTGNHEYFSGVDEWTAEVARLGLTVLDNRHLRLEHGGGSVLLAGVHDWHAERQRPEHKCDPAGAVKNAEASDVRILLSHQPGSLKAVRDVVIGPDARCFDLMLSGHTHGGQFIPWNLFVSLAHPVNAGLKAFDLDHGRLWVYVNRGTGYWGPPMRLGVPAEITHLKLRRV